jgi:hypothetical protein
MEIILSVEAKCMILGAVVFAELAAALFFLKFWKTTKDGFFMFFALSFFLDAISRILLTIIDGATDMTNTDYAPLVYMIRLISFFLIIYAIARKNWVRGKNH